MRLSEDNNNKYSKFDVTKSLSYQEQNNLNLLQHIIIKHMQACAPGMLPNITNVILICKQLTSKSRILIGPDNLFSLMIFVRDAVRFSNPGGLAVMHWT